MAGKRNNPAFQTLVANLSGMVRNETLEDREYLVVPMVMMVEGVLNGSDGALYYPAEEMAKVPDIWNHKPVVIQHPTLNGKPLSACSPEAIQRFKVGIILNTQFDGKRLKAEAWMEPSRLKKIDVRVLDAVKNGQMVQVSTGLFTENEYKPGIFNGTGYEAIARDLKPDHLAILPDSVGACSIADGAGLLRNELSHDGIREELYKVLSPGEDPTDLFIADVFDDFFIFEQGGKMFHQKYSSSNGTIALGGMRQPVVREIQYKLEDGTVVGNEELVLNRVEKRGDKWCVVHGHPQKAGSKTDKPEGTVIKCFDTKAEADAMHRAIMANNIDQSNVQKKNLKGETMDKEAIVNDLIANGRWEEKDREWLMGLEEDQLSKMEPVVNEDGQEGDGDGEGNEEPPAEPMPKAKEEGQEDGDGDTPPVANATDFMSQLPPEYREVLNEALQTQAEKKSELISVIVANKKNIFTQEQLSSMSVNELKAIAALAQVPEEKEKTITPSFLGMAPVANVGGEVEEPLELPAMSFEK